MTPPVVLSRLASVLALCCLLAAGCDRGGETQKGSSDAGDKAAETASAGEAPLITAAARKEALEIFQTRCTACHGPQGKGDGPASKGLSPHPRDFSDPNWQNSVTDKHIESIIVYGGAAVGRSPAMPGNPDLAAKPAVVAALREYVRSLKQP